MRTTHAPEHPDGRFVAETGGPGTRLRDFFDARDPDALYLVDPNGNWLMAYTGTIESKRLLKDLKTLMRLSSIG